MKLVGAEFKTDKKQDLWRRFLHKYCVCNSCVQAGGQMGKRLEGDPLSPEFPKDCDTDDV